MKHWVLYQLRAKNAHGLHSPFLFNLYKKVILRSRKEKQLDVELLKRKFLKDKSKIQITDFKTNTVEITSIGEIAKNSLSTSKFSSFLYLLADFLNAKSALETGTSLGIATSYLARSASLEQIISLEGNTQVAAIAKAHLKEISKVTIEEGNIHDTFSKTLQKINPDFVFLDADHRSKTILENLAAVKKNAPNAKCIIIHDIYWSEDMLRGWNEIIKDPNYPLTIDLFQAGIIFPDQKIEKQHFQIRF